MDKMIIYAVSDSVGETAGQIALAVSKQFDIVEFEIRVIGGVSDTDTLEKTVLKAKEENALIVFTIIVEELKNYLIDCATINDVTVVDVMTPVLTPLMKKLGLAPKREPGLLRKVDDKYFKKIESVEFAIKYDDGKDTRGIMLADIVLVGVSRTSKTPLSMYLAHKNFKVANVPILYGVAPPQELFSIPKEKIVGLVSDPDQLCLIRRERLKGLGLGDSACYASMNKILEELEYAKDIMKKLDCRIIDTTNKAVEETAAIILNETFEF